MKFVDVGDEVRIEKCAHYGGMARSGGPCTHIYNESIFPGCEYRGKWVTAATVHLGDTYDANRFRK